MSTESVPVAVGIVSKFLGAVAFWVVKGSGIGTKGAGFDAEVLFNLLTCSALIAENKESNLEEEEVEADETGLRDGLLDNESLVHNFLAQGSCTGCKMIKLLMKI